MISGRLRRPKLLISTKGRQVMVEIVEPEPTVENIRELRAVSDRWHEQAKQVEGGRAQRRAYFAASVAFAAAEKLLTPTCCVLVARETASGEILGIATYRPDTGPWFIDNLTVSPANQPGGKSRDQIRGIGTLMVGVIAEDVSTRQCTDLHLYALDEQAEAFWHGRGFHNTTQPLRMSCPEVRELARELATSHPDRPDEGDAALAGEIGRWRQIEVPAALAKLRGL